MTPPEHQHNITYLEDKADFITSHNMDEYRLYKASVISQMMCKKGQNLLRIGSLT